MKQTSIFLAIAILPAVTTAQEAPGETQAIRCSALAHIHTNLTSPPAFNVAMGQSAEFYGGVFAAFQAERTGAGATNGEVSLRRDGVEAELRKSWLSRPAVVVNEMALCNSWRAEFAPRIGAANGAIRSPKQIVEIVGTPPSEPADGEVEKWRPLVSGAFNAWSAAGSKTGGESRDEIKRKLTESLKGKP